MEVLFTKGVGRVEDKQKGMTKYHKASHSPMSEGSSGDTSKWNLGTFEDRCLQSCDLE